MIEPLTKEDRERLLRNASPRGVFLRYEETIKRFEKRIEQLSRVARDALVLAGPSAEALDLLGECGEIEFELKHPSPFRDAAEAVRRTSKLKGLT